MLTLIFCLILYFRKIIAFQTLVLTTRKLTFEKVEVFKGFKRFSSSGFHSESLTAILCWGGCLSALSLLSKVKTGPKWTAGHICALNRLPEHGGQGHLGGAQPDTFPKLDSDKGWTIHVASKWLDHLFTKPCLALPKFLRQIKYEIFWQYPSEIL